ncbi:alpha-L-iduronidase [Macrosteles quadrilineatus]|uniref:alpha-L-iduronidase n=1 Tax=Macrosteles quadrilineatus TaxID=74068 RepID=UPI0023E2F2BA|nr:alpha-L-iduronidase [Macrosteles quadrilineatus]
MSFTMGLLIIVFLCLTICHLKAQELPRNYKVIVDVTSTVGNLRRIWDNTGLSPPGPGEQSVRYLTSRDMLVNLALVGSLPFKGISHVRIHWLLDLITVEDKSVPLYDYSLLDDLLLWMRLHRMRPGFELMGNPGNLFSDLDSNPNTIILWQNFIIELAQHLVSMYGKEEVKRWRFELWNEPDSKQYNILNLTVSGYNKYAVASMKGLAVHGLSLSGPAGTFRDLNHHNISWGFLQMCSSMISLTGSCGVEAITFHKKGEGMAETVVSSTSEFYSTATTLYPSLKNLSFANNEADILSGWWREETWRGDVAYASYVSEVLMLFLEKIKMEGLPLSYISNDNGFMNEPPSYFNQRTLLTRFQYNGPKGSLSQFVRKPVMITMALLSYLGPKELPVFLRHLGNHPCNSRLSVLAGSDGVDIGPGWSAAIMMSLGPSNQTFCPENKLDIKIGRLPLSKDFKFVVYQLDNEQTNPRTVWEQNGTPDHPSSDLLHRMRKQEGPAVVQSGIVTSDWLVLSLPARNPSITMVHLCTNTQKQPAKVLSFHALNVTFNQVLLLWHDSDTRCLKTYEVYFCSGECQNGNFSKITDRNIIMLSYQFKSPSDSLSTEGTRGKYIVRARDYWDQVSDFSDVLQYN